MSSKLARQMAYKARLEEEHRLFEERCKISQFRDFISDADEDDAEMRKETERKKEENYRKEKEKWMAKKKEGHLRASRFADLKRRRREEKRKMEEARKVLETEDFWQELDIIIRENGNTLKQLTEYRECVENILHSRQVEPMDRHNLPLIQDDNQSREGEVGQTEGDEELEDIYVRIRELERSIVTLDVALERCDIERMRKKTLQVKRRMTETVGDGDLLSSCLTPTTVDMFLANSNLWEKYKTS